MASGASNAQEPVQFSRTQGKRFSVSAVYSAEQTRYLQADGSVGQQKPAAARIDSIVPDPQVL